MPTSPGRAARLKGANFERLIANQLAELTGLDFKRGLGQTRNGGEEHSDVYCEGIPLHIECKHQHKTNIKAAMKQATEDSQKSGHIPVVISRDTGGEILVTMKMKDWTEWLKIILTPESGSGQT